MRTIHIGDRIKLVREKRNETLLAVANHLGVTEATVQRYESGNIKNLKLDTISKIANFLNVNPAYLMGWEEKDKRIELSSQYHYLPTSISAGLPINIDGVTSADKISLPDSVMGKWAGKEDIFITKISGDSMNRVMPDGSLIAVKPVALPELKNGDMVVYSNNYEYSVKYFYRQDDKLIFKPSSQNPDHFEHHYSVNDNIVIHGKVVVYIIEMD